MVATFSRCVVVTHWLPYTLVQIFFHFFLEFKKVWYCLSSLSIQIGVFTESFCITLLYIEYCYAKEYNIH